MEKHFGHSGMFHSGGCYTCDICGKKTRETGHHESESNLCKACLMESYIEIDMSDNGSSREEAEKKFAYMK